MVTCTRVVLYVYVQLGEREQFQNWGSVTSVLLKQRYIFLTITLRGTITTQDYRMLIVGTHTCTYYTIDMPTYPTLNVHVCQKNDPRKSAAMVFAKQKINNTHRYEHIVFTTFTNSSMFYNNQQ